MEHPCTSALSKKMSALQNLSGHYRDINESEKVEFSGRLLWY